MSGFMKKLFALLSALTLAAGLAGVSIAAIEGSGHDFSAFAYYRIAFGAIVLATGYTGIVSWTN